jgi:hypothetical protein
MARQTEESTNLKVQPAKENCKWQLIEADIAPAGALLPASTFNPQCALAPARVAPDRAAQQASVRVTAHTSPTNRTPDIAGRSFTTTDLSNQ